MRTPRFIACVVALAAASLAAAPLAQAQATRTWVSGVGDDANPCSRTAPCKTFAGAISHTAAGGTIHVLDPGGYGVVTITKSINILSPPGYGGVLAAQTNGIVVAAGASDVVRLRGLDIHGAGTGINGIDFRSGKALHVEHSAIDGFTNAGIKFVANSQLHVNTSNIRNTKYGIQVGSAGAGGVAKASINRTEVEENQYGIFAQSAAKVTARNCVSAGNGTGFYAVHAGTTLNVESCLAEGNYFGVYAEADGTARVSATTVTDNVFGLYSSAASILTRGNNTVEDNTVNGSFTGTFAPK
jgi:Right handed beta helix region